MNQTALDTMLSQALAEMSMANWSDSQKILASRLEMIAELGNRRLNLFLLSISAASGGYQDVANQLWSQAQQTPLEAEPLRYFDLQFPPNDPRQSMLIDLERAWWDFNGWNASSPTPSLALERASEAVDWAYVLEATLNGQDADLEDRYGRSLHDQIEGLYFLWNLLALAYLQAGNVRTYEEMVASAPPPPQAGSVPPALVEAMNQHNLQAGLEVFQRSQWLTNAALYAQEAVSEPSHEPEAALTQEEWSQAMIDGFGLLERGQFLEAARAFQYINFRTEPSQRLLLSRNALALAFFKQGDYTQCERVYEEFRNLLAQFPVNPTSELAQNFRGWLESVESAPEDGQPFFSPFAGNRSDWNAAPAEDLDFWREFDAIVSLLGEEDHSSAIYKLQKVEVHLGPSLEPYQSYLMTAMFVASFVMAGDHSEVQALAPQLPHLEAQAVFPADKLEDITDTLRWAGFEKLYARIAGGPEARATPINPWDDLSIS